MAADEARRLSVTLDKEQVAKLSSAIDEAEPDPRSLVRLLDGIPEAYEAARQGLEEAQAGKTVPLDEL